LIAVHTLISSKNHQALDFVEQQYDKKFTDRFDFYNRYIMLFLITFYDKGSDFFFLHLTMTALILETSS
jgi:hypothetical protein